MNAEEKNETLNAAIAKAEHYCASRESCRFDLKRKFRQWEIPEHLWEQILEHLEEHGFVDEKRYIRTFVESKFRHNQWGAIKIRHALKQKQMDEAKIEAELQNMDADEYMAVLRDLVTKKSKSIKGHHPAEKRQKLVRSLTTKGFEPEMIISILDEKSIFKT